MEMPDMQPTDPKTILIKEVRELWNKALKDRNNVITLKGDYDEEFGQLMTMHLTLELNGKFLRCVVPLSFFPQDSANINIFEEEIIIEEINDSKK